MKYEVSITHKDVKDVKVKTNIVYTEVDDEFNVHKYFEYIEDAKPTAARKALESHIKEFGIHEGDSLKVDYIKEFKPVGD